MRVLSALVAVFLAVTSTSSLVAEQAPELRQAAEQGDADAQFGLGNAYYYKGEGVEQDYAGLADPTKTPLVSDTLRAIARQPGATPRQARALTYDQARALMLAARDRRRRGRGRAYSRRRACTISGRGSPLRRRRR